MEKSKAEAAAVASRLQAKDASVEPKKKPALDELMEPADAPGPAPATEFKRTDQAQARHQDWASKQQRPSVSSLPWQSRALVVALTSLSFGLFGYRMYLQYGHQYGWSAGPQAYPLFTKEQLARMVDGQSRRICIAILGEVYDVSKAPQFYGKGQGYAHFTGRDASRAFITGEFRDEGLREDVSDFTDEQRLGLVNWKDFYLREYKYVGRVAGAFFDAEGQITDALRQVLRGAARARAANEEREKNKKLDPSCSMRWAQDEGSTVWCDDDFYPRQLTEMVNGKAEQRCACFKDIGWSNSRNVYDGCSPDAHKCQLTPPEGAAAAEVDGAAEDDQSSRDNGAADEGGSGDRTNDVSGDPAEQAAQDEL